MQIEQLLQIRKQEGQEMAKTEKVRIVGHKWLVPSQSSNKQYEVILRLDKSLCTCLDFVERGIKCKHIFAVEITITKKVNADGSITETKRTTYSQDWVAYDKAQTHEKELFIKLLKELCQTIENELIVRGKGRLKMPMRYMVFCSALKVFTTFSLRRFSTDIKGAKELGYIKNVPHYSTTALYMENEELAPTIQELITASSLPLRSVETKFAIDSTGFRTTRFNEYCKEKHNTGQEHDWIKARICYGVSTHIITGVEVLPENSGGSPQFIPLAEKTHNAGFTIEEMSADKAYSSRDNNAYIDQIGGTPFIAFRSNAIGKPREKSHVWRKMFNYFVCNREDFLEHYHKRSNIESTNNMIKSKFSDLIRSRNEAAQVNEVLLKVLCHNICVVIQEMFELGIEPSFLNEMQKGI